MKRYLFVFCSFLFLFAHPLFSQNVDLKYDKSIADSLYPFHPDVSVPFTSSNLPIVVITLNERMADKEADRRVEAEMTILYRTDGTRNYISDVNLTSDENVINYHGKIGIKYRGNSSYAHSDKKPFGLKTQDENGDKVNADILGMGADSDWALLAPYNDKSMIRDVLTFDLCRNYLEYVPSGRHCELVLNGVYQGVYVMAARVRRGAHRIDLPKPKSSGDDLTGGYLLEIDRRNEPGFLSDHKALDLYGNPMELENPRDANHYFQYKYPEEEDFFEGMGAQRNYIIERVRQFENMMASESFADPESGYASELDVLSTIDYILAQEITRNIDGYRLSTPIYKYRDSQDPRFKFSIWDFNISMGNVNYCDGWSTEGWIWDMNKFNEPDKVPFWFHKLLNDETFKENLIERWRYYRTGNFTNDNVAAKIDSLVLLLSEAEARNTSAWNRWDAEVWPNYYISRSWSDEIEYLRYWLDKRLAWIDARLTNNAANFVANASFDSDRKRRENSDEILLSNWMTTGGVELTDQVKWDGNYSLVFYSQGEAEQIITKLAAGKYTFKAWVKTVGNPQAKAIVQHYSEDSTHLITHIVADSGFYKIEIPNIEVKTGCCRIVFQTDSTGDANARLYIDCISLTRSNVSGIYPYVGNSKKEIKVYPNPFDQHLVFQYIPRNEKQVILIYSALGVVVERFEENVTPGMLATIKKSISSSLSPGVYTYRIIDRDEVYSGKMVKR